MNCNPTIRRVLAAWLLVLTCQGAFAQGWTPLTNTPPMASGDGPSTSLLLTDGTVMVQEVSQSGATGKWWRLTPDDTGSYINGTWTQLASMPSGYAPLYYGSAVLSDGRVIVEGGEYNGSSQVFTNLGAIYNPHTNAWTAVAPPPGWEAIGDAASVVLADGTFMLAGFFYGEVALLDATSLSWTVKTPAGKADGYDEEGWTLLPNGDVLTVDVQVASNSEIYNPTSNSWTSVAMPTNLAEGSPCYEMGPAVLQPDGTVFALGTNYTGYTALYSVASGTWTRGPALGRAVQDGPAALLPSGDVLFGSTVISSGSTCYTTDIEYMSFTGSGFGFAPPPLDAKGQPTYVTRMLVLPTGQIFYTDSIRAEVFTGTGTYESAWQPTISSYPTTISAGGTNYSITGKQFNGLSQGAMYGDDVQSATNYPLVRIVNNASGHVFYMRTHNHSTMAVATGTESASTEFDVPATTETGAAKLYVVANGIPSAPVSLVVE